MIIMIRPEFDNIQTFEEFNKYYWYRDELIEICKSHGLKSTVTKIELYEVLNYPRLKSQWDSFKESINFVVICNLNYAALCVDVANKDI